ncbi:hypothetical protein GOODEAATRI_020151 [Goodea atripinnis]|uniref:Uncharacterized protein n=1 Tax=Goodea atripinnis TaxID=208336 RepID=A0ABV0P6D3_9TELE
MLVLNPFCMNAGLSEQLIILNFDALDQPAGIRPSNRSHFEFKLKSYAFLPARRHSHAVPLLSGSRSRSMWKRPPCWNKVILCRLNLIQIQIKKYFIHPKGKLNVVVAHNMQEGSRVAVCPTADLKKPLTEDSLSMYNSLMKRMFGVLHNVLHFLKNPCLHNDLQRFQRSPQNTATLLYQLVELF